VTPGAPLPAPRQPPGPEAAAARHLGAATWIWTLLALLLALPPGLAAQDSRAPRPIYQEPPSIPKGLAPGDLPGQADVQLVIDETGAIIEAKVTDASHPALGAAALAAAKKWRFEPGMIRGRPAVRTVSIPFMFRAPDGPARPEVLGRQIFVDLGEVPVMAETLPSMPMPLRKAWPRYPAQLETTGARGSVTVAIVIDRNGDVINPEVVSSDHPAFNSPALASALALRFEPIRNLKGELLLVSMLVRYEFHPDMLKEEERERLRRIVLPPGLEAPWLRPLHRNPPVFPPTPRPRSSIRTAPRP
jgi:TonB family protein